MQTLELNKMGLAPMTEVEMQEQNGGGWLRDVVFSMISSWDDIKKGARDGWNSVHYN